MGWPGQTLRMGEGRAWWPAGLEHPGGGEWHEFDGGWRPGQTSRTWAEAECGGRPVWHVRAVEGGPSTEAAGSTLSQLPEHGAGRPGQRAAWQVARGGAQVGDGQAVRGGGGPEEHGRATLRSDRVIRGALRATARSGREEHARWGKPSLSNERRTCGRKEHEPG
jgi:hypothetical protein